VNIDQHLDPSGLSLAPSPHFRNGITVRSLMLDVVIALLPATVAGIYFFGMDAALVTASAIGGALATEAGIARLRGEPISIRDGSALVTGLLLALCLPPGVPLWLPVVGAIFAIAVGKALFGGLGMNIFNPALVGRAFLVASFPTLMTTWRWPVGSGDWMAGEFDALSTATPLDLLRYEGVMTPLTDLFVGRVGGSLGETSVLALLLGAAYLLARGVIDWRIPTAYLGTVAVLAGLFGVNPLFHLFAGSLMLGAFYMATDYVSGAVTPGGRVVFGIGCGVLTMLIRIYGGYPEGVTFAILLMNAAVPLIERFTAPRRLGGGGESSAH